MSGDLFFLTESTATLALELPVKGVHGLAFGFELVLVSFYRLQRELWIHLDERHRKRLGQYSRRSNHAGRSHRD